MYKKWFMFSILILYVKCEECDQLGILLYQDLNCKPHTVAGNPCPTHYECLEFTKSKEYCFFRSERIRSGERVNDSLIYSSCRIGCHCYYDPKNPINRANFDCSVLDCPENLGYRLKGPECHWTFKPDECCAVGQKCPPFNNTTTCTVEGKQYKEGQSFYPSNSCLNCVCEKGFEGQLVEPFCKRRTCAEEIENTDKLIANCAPVYFSSGALCCPFKWVCPSSSDRIRQISASKSASGSDLTCRWGNRSLKLGEGLERQVEHYGTVENVTCECLVPPLLTCK